MAVAWQSWARANRREEHRPVTCTLHTTDFEHMSRRNAEIVGAGLAGLSAAIALAQRGLSVRLHERHASLRREGFGITVHANGLRVLDALGAREDATRDGVQLGFSELRDASNAVIARNKLDARACRLSRFHLIAASGRSGEGSWRRAFLGSAAIAATPGWDRHFRGWKPPIGRSHRRRRRHQFAAAQFARPDALADAAAGRCAEDDDCAPKEDVGLADCRHGGRMVVRKPPHHLWRLQPAGNLRGAVLPVR